MGSRTPARWTWRGWHIKLVDGTTILKPDTPGNQALYPQHGGEKAGAGFQSAHREGVISLAHGALRDVAMGPYQGKGTGEHALFRELLRCFAAGDIMLADSHYASCFLIAAQMAMGVDFVFEQHGARHTEFRTGEKLGRREVCKRALDALFLHRWNVELDIGNLKDTFGMVMLSSKTPEMCTKELRVYLLAYKSDSAADGSGVGTSRRIAPAIELQAYRAGLAGLESQAVPCGCRRRPEGPVPADCIRPCGQTTRQD